MIFRLSQKLASKLKVKLQNSATVDPNPFVDWSASLFTADRTQYLILTNTASLYSTIMPARGISDESKFLIGTLGWLHDFMVADGLGNIHEQFIAPATEIRFSKALNRSVTGSMNDLIFQAKILLTHSGLSPLDASRNMNESPMSAIKYANPRKMLMLLAVEASKDS